MKLKKNMALVLMLCAFAAGRAAAADIDFNFEIPTIPYPPQITDVESTIPAAGVGIFTVTATIAGQMQMKGFCDVEPRENCTAADWYQAADTEVVPNPPTIQNAKVFYYKNDNMAGAASVDMTYESTSGKYKAAITVPGLVQGDKITYYIVAIDSRGNVASQVPDTSQRPCPSSSSWDASLATPATNSCSYASSYTRCNQYVTGTPAPCASTYTIGDPNGDVCGEPGTGNCGDAQCVITGSQADKVDILGISAGADGTYVCVNMGLKAPPPSSSDSPPIEGYIAIFFNPDIPDPNPGDTHIENATAITYAPEAVGSDPTLVKVFWSGDCLTDPTTDNPLDCKLITAGDDLKIEYGGGSLKYMVKKSGTGNPLAVPFNILGNTTKQTVIIGLTGEINLSGGTAFWISDLTPGFAFYQKNQTVNAGTECVPDAPPVTSTLCSVDGSGGVGGQCPKSGAMPTQNKCKINFNKSIIPCASEYRIYRNTVNSASGAVKIDTVTDNGGSSYSFTDTHASLDGKTYYYFLSGYNGNAAMETKSSDWTKTSCTVEDWIEPEKPAIASAATPPGNEGTCKIDWSITAADFSIANFHLSRSGDGGVTYATFNSPELQTPYDPNSLAYSWTDTTALELGKIYKYKVTATDRGGNTATSEPADCTAEDKKAPAMITSLVATNVTGKIGVKMDWQAGGESDLAGYNAYWCRQNNKATDCRAAGSFSKLNSSLFAANNYQAANDTRPEVFNEAGDYCFYVEACDNCLSEGTCPGNTGAANCSGFPPGGAGSPNHVKCLPLKEEVELISPAFPAGVACEAPPEGRTVSLSWNHVCHNADGTAFLSYSNGACGNPEAIELVGYKAIFGPRGAVPDITQATALNNAGSVALGTDPVLDHKNIVNGQEYCYSVYGIDGSGNFSKESVAYPKTEVCCSPKDILAPSKPAMNEISYTASDCTLSWNKVEDKDALTYSVYRCKGDTAACATKAAFGAAVQSGITEAQGLSYADFDITKDQKYQYCVTASDPSGNESRLIETSGNINCGSCTPTDPPPPPVINVSAAPLTATDNKGAKLTWTRNTEDNGGGGYNVYRCPAASCASNGSAIQSCLKTVPTDAAPLNIGGEPEGDWYYGVTYMRDCGDAVTESKFDTSQGGSIDGPIHVDKVCTKCIVVSSCADYDAKTGCNPITRGISGTSGFKVELLDKDGNSLGSSVLDSDGNYILTISNDAAGIDLVETYRVIVVVPEAQKNSVPCTPGFPGSDCTIVLDRFSVLKDDGTVSKTQKLYLPDPGNCRADCGNPDCSDSIDVGDLLIFKAAFGGNLGDAKYKTYADFDGNGSVDVEDFLILKKNFGKYLDAAPTFDAALCKP